MQASAPPVGLALSRAGVTGVQKAIRIRRGDHEILMAAEIDCTVDLARDQKGVHMSRFPELFDEAIDEVVLGQGLLVEALADRIASQIVERQNALRAEVRIEAQYPLERRTPVSDLPTQEIAKLIGIAAASPQRVRRVVGVEACRALARSADVLIEGFRPGVLEKLSLGPDTLLGDNPKLVYGRMTGWGQYGPNAHTAGHDINYIALSGALYSIGPGGGPPVPPLNLIGDFGGGALYLAMGVLAGIISARATGKGQVIDCSMVEGSGAAGSRATRSSCGASQRDTYVAPSSVKCTPSSRIGMPSRVAVNLPPGDTYRFRSISVYRPGCATRKSR